LRMEGAGHQNRAQNGNSATNSATTYDAHVTDM
jgi:hypothetical protein